MPDEPTESQQADPIAEPIDPEPGRLEPIPRRAPSSNGAVDGLVDATARVVTPFVRLGWRTARGMGRRLGFNDAVRHQVDRALDSDTAARTTQQVLESDAANQVWDKVLESEEAQKLVERVAEAPEVRSAITAQGLGLLEDVRADGAPAPPGGSTMSSSACFARRAGVRRARSGRSTPGGGTRLLAIGFDAAVLNGILLLISAPAGAAAERGVLPRRRPQRRHDRLRGGRLVDRGGGLPRAVLDPRRAHARHELLRAFVSRPSPEVASAPRQDIRRLIGFASGPDPVRPRLPRHPHQRAPARLARPLRRHGRALRRPRDRQRLPGWTPPPVRR